MRLCVVSDLITHTRLQRKCSPILEFSVKFTFRAQKNVTLEAPMIGAIARGVLNHAHADASEVLRSPIGTASLAAMLSRRELRPISRSEWDVRHVHDDSPGRGMRLAEQSGRPMCESEPARSTRYDEAQRLRNDNHQAAPKRDWM